MASFWSGKGWTGFPLHITESHAYLHFLTTNTGRSTSLLWHKAAQSPQTNKNMESHELSCPHTHNDSTDGHNQIKYSQHRLSLYQQPFNFSSTILLRLFWTMRAHFHPAQGVCSHPSPCWHWGSLSQLVTGQMDGREQLTFPFLCCLLLL